MFYYLVWLMAFIYILSGMLMAKDTINHPAPFQKAKEMALGCPINENGDHVWSIELNKDGALTEYQIIYGSFRDATGEHDVVILVKRHGNAWIAVGHDGIVDDYRAATNQTNGFIVITKDSAIKAAFVFFKELVQGTLI